jgi:dTDP-3-amino-3,4,6-trideoxy-alpha-D-glucose transaminase
MLPFHDVGAQYLAHRREIDAAVARVLERGTYLLGEELARFEADFAAWLGARRALGVASGTSALELALRALDVGPGDEVAVPAMTAAPTAMAVASVGATPLVVDVLEDSLDMDPEALARAASPALAAVVPVHLYGRCADMTAIGAFASERRIPVIEDAAQAHGAEHRGRRAGTLARAACFSFYPTKNLATAGDAGAVVTDDEALADRVARLRNYGRPDAVDYRFEEPGTNARMDELHAAILSVKLPLLAGWNERRRARAAWYREALRGTAVALPEEDPAGRSAWHQFVVRTTRRDAFREHLSRHGVQTAIHYPACIHELAAMRGRIRVPEAPRRAERAAREVVSLPIYPELPEAHAEQVVAAVRSFR